MNFLAFGANFISCWNRIRIRNADPDPGDKSNADPDTAPDPKHSTSGSLFSIFFSRWFILWALAVQGLLAQLCCSCKFVLASFKKLNTSSKMPAHVLWQHTPPTVHCTDCPRSA